MISGNSGQPLIVFFAPEAGVSPHFNAVLMVARTLQEQGRDVAVVKCPGMLSRCPVMDMYQYPYDLTPDLKANTCAECQDYAMKATSAYGLPIIDLGQCYGPNIEAKLQNAMEGLPADLRDFEYDGIPFGRLAVLDLVYAVKVSDFESIEEHYREAWITYIQGCMTSYLVMDELFRQLSVHALVHYSEYSLMVGARLAASRHGVPAYSIIHAAQGGVNRQRINVYPKTWVLQAQQQRQTWPEWRNLPLDPDQVAAVADDLIMRLGSQSVFVYSPAKTLYGEALYEQLGLSRRKKLLVAFTSSLDEMLAAKMYSDAQGLALMHDRQPFEDQIAWLSALCSFVEGREDLQLVVRVHPREGRNHRDRVLSQHLSRLQAAFKRPFNNCTFVWPEDTPSSYDLGEMADLVLTSWSSMGLELARLGVPVLTSTRGLSPYPADDFLEWAETPEEYFSKLEGLLDVTPDVERLQRAFRCYHLFHLGNSLDFQDLVPIRDFTGLPPFDFPAEASRLDAAIVHGQDVLVQNLDRARTHQSHDNEHQEQEALRRQLRRIIRFLLAGIDGERDVTMAVLMLPEGEARLADVSLPPETMVLMIQGGDISLHYQGRTLCKRSPMVARLAPLCSQIVSFELVGFLSALLAHQSAHSSAAKVRALAAAGDFDVASRHAIEALGELGDAVELFIAVAEVDFLSGNVAQARELLISLQRIWPQNSTLLNNLAAVHWASGESVKALQCARQAFEQAPTDRDVVLNLADMLRALGYPHEAAAVLGAFLSQQEDQEVAEISRTMAEQGYRG